MKVFVSWSGEKSKNIANAIRNWLPGVIQAVRPYFSPDDVAKGSRWATEIATELDSSRIGLLILTAENIEAPWLIFEAGALGKNLQTSKVCPLLFEIEATDVKGPLVQFQGAKFGKEEMQRVVKMINNELGDAALPTNVLDSVFNMWWPKLENEVEQILAAAHLPSKEDQRTDRDILEEILTLSRSVARGAGTGRGGFSLSALEDLNDSYSRLHSIAANIDNSELHEAVQALRRPVQYFLRDIRAPRATSILDKIAKSLVDEGAQT